MCIIDYIKHLGHAGKGDMLFIRKKHMQKNIWEEGHFHLPYAEKHMGGRSFSPPICRKAYRRKVIFTTFLKQKVIQKSVKVNHNEICSGSVWSDVG